MNNVNPKQVGEANKAVVTPSDVHDPEFIIGHPDLLGIDTPASAMCLEPLNVMAILLH